MEKHPLGMLAEERRMGLNEEGWLILVFGLVRIEKRRLVPQWSQQGQ